MPTALWIWSETFSVAFDKLDWDLQRVIEDKLEEVSQNLTEYPHKPLHHYRREFKLRVGDYRVIYSYRTQPESMLLLLYVAHRSRVYKEYREG